MVAAEFVTAGCNFFRRDFPDSRSTPSQLTYAAAKGEAFYARTSKFTAVLAAKMKGGGDEKEYSSQRLPKIPVNTAVALAARAAVAVFALGFIDAGYSGDWSRIGAVSKEVEDWLKIAAFLVVPLCVLLVVSISSTEES